MVKKNGSSDLILKNIDASLTHALVEQDVNKIKKLIALRKTITVFKSLTGRRIRTVLLLLQNHHWLSRFFHNMDKADDPGGALDALQRLYDRDPQAFSEKFEFCLAFALVWDKDLEQSAMEETYRFYLNHQKKMKIKPGALPCEINVYVVDTRLSEAERNWVLKNYKSKNLNPVDLYESVPWTSNSHSHPHTLENLRKFGGVCTDQTYFTKNVLQLFGVPVARLSGHNHAWAGVLENRSGKTNFEVGRFTTRQSFRGRRVVTQKLYTPVLAEDPTNKNSKKLTDSEVKMTWSFALNPGGVKTMETSLLWLDAALWRHKRMQDINPLYECLKKSLETEIHNIKAWRFLSRLVQEKKINEKIAITWAQTAIKRLLKQYPDIVVEVLSDIIPHIMEPGSRTKICKKAYLGLEKKRPDLISSLKLTEGKAWLINKQLDKGLKCFIYPLTTPYESQLFFSPGFRRLEICLNSYCDNDDDLISAYEKVFKSTGEYCRHSRVVKVMREKTAKKLFDLHTDQGDSIKANSYKKYF